MQRLGLLVVLLLLFGGCTSNGGRIVPCDLSRLEIVADKPGPHDVTPGTHGYVQFGLRERAPNATARWIVPYAEEFRADGPLAPSRLNVSWHLRPIVGGPSFIGWGPNFTQKFGMQLTGTLRLTAILEAPCSHAPHVLTGIIPTFSTSTWQLDVPTGQRDRLPVGEILVGDRGKVAAIVEWRSDRATSDGGHVGVEAAGGQTIYFSRSGSEGTVDGGGLRRVAWMPNPGGPGVSLGERISVSIRLDYQLEAPEEG